MDKYTSLTKNKKIIHTGTEAEMQRAYFVMAWDEKSLHKMYQEPNLSRYKEKYRVLGVVGKINLVPG
jgi:hypothetical protein